MIKNKKYIMMIITIMFCINLVSALPFYYKVSMHYNSGELEVKNINIIRSEIDRNEISGDYSIEVIDNAGKTLSKNLFQIQNYEVTDDFEKGTSELKVLNESDFEIFVPYREGSNIVISDDINNKELENVDINKFLFKKASDIGVDAEKEISNTEVKADGGNNLAFWVGLFIVLITIIFVIIYAIRKKF